MNRNIITGQALKEYEKLKAKLVEMDKNYILILKEWEFDIRVDYGKINLLNKGKFKNEIKGF